MTMGNRQSRNNNYQSNNINGHNNNDQSNNINGQINSDQSNNDQSNNINHDNNCNSQALPLKFHTKHGKDILICNNGFSARKRTDSFYDGIAFSNRPVEVNEHIFLMYSNLQSTQFMCVIFGFTVNDPSMLCDSDLRILENGFPSSQQVIWADNVIIGPDDVFSYYANQQGEIHSSINGKDTGSFFAGMDVTQPLYALINIHGGTGDTITFTDHLHRPTVALPEDQGSPNVDQPQMNLEPSEVPAENVDREESSSLLQRGLTSMRFHAVHGWNISLSSDQLIASRIELEWCQGYAFMSRPLSHMEELLIRVEESFQDAPSGLAFGLTSCDPCKLDPELLPDDCDELMDRMEYWVVLKDVGNRPQSGDELGFTLTYQGIVLISKNNLPHVTLIHVDHTQELWPFFAIHGNTQTIKVLSRQHGSPGSPLTSSIHTESTSSKKECSVCFERPVDSALYDCGHMCMCFECANQIKSQPDSQCPICRAGIKDVIRIFQS